MANLGLNLVVEGAKIYTELETIRTEENTELIDRAQHLIVQLLENLPENLQ